MSVGDVNDAVKDDGPGDRRPRRDKYLAIYIAILAVILSVAAVAGGNAAKDAARANLDATNLWAFFQAKTIRRTTYELAADNLDVQLITRLDLAGEQRATLQSKIDAYRAKAAEYRSEPSTGEGTTELLVRARGLEAIRDLALKRDPYFDYAQALIQVAIVLASVAIIAGGSLSLTLSFVIAALGVASLANGYLLVVDIEPFIADGVQQVSNWMVQNARPATR